MKKENIDKMVEKTHALMNIPYCCVDLKKVAQDWLDALGSDEESKATTAYFKELEESVVPIDDLLKLANSAKGISYFGKEKAKALAEHAMNIKSKGAKYCDCEACSFAFEILGLKQ